MRTEHLEEEVLIEAGRIERQYWRDLWRYRELFYFLARRDILLRYNQTTIGVAWAVMRPLAMMLIFSVVFGKVAKLPSGSVAYPVLVAAAVVPWQFFSSAISEAGNSLAENANLLSKVYFPRMIVPGSAVIVSLIDSLVSSVILVAAMAWYQVLPTWRLLFIPVFSLLAFASAMGLGLWFSAMNAKYRDFRYALPFAVQLGLYITPVGFLTSKVTEKFGPLCALNPMVGVIDGFRWAVGAIELNPTTLGISTISALVLLVLGIRQFRKVERLLPDLL